MDLALRESLGTVNFEEFAMSVDGVIRQIELIQEIQRRVMRSGEHYGVIPGCGDKPTLLKPGAEKLGFTFRLAPEFEVTLVDHSAGHREYQIKCRLRHIPTGTMVGEGVGTCTTLEGKYRYRSDSTGNPVPAEYWKSRDKDLLGGPFNTTRKIGGEWFIFQRVEHDNPADYYNTCEKMAKKRAHVDAILTATAASDIFTQDVEDMQEVLLPKAETQAEPQAPLQVPKKKEPVPTPVEKQSSPAAITNVLAVSHKDGETAGKPWRLYGIKDANGVVYKTLSESLADVATTAQSTGTRVKIHYRVEKSGNSVEAIEILKEENSELRI
jgi:hypothetical protein